MVQSYIDTVQMILSDWPDTGGGTTEKNVSWLSWGNSRQLLHI